MSENLMPSGYDQSFYPPENADLLELTPRQTPQLQEQQQQQPPFGMQQPIFNKPTAMQPPFPAMDAPGQTSPPEVQIISPKDGKEYPSISSRPCASDACATIVQGLMQFNQSSDEEFSRKACESLVKKMKDKREELDALIVSVYSRGEDSKRCITIARTLDGRLQVAGRKGFPHVVYSKIFRWPDLHKNELKHLPVCENAFDLKGDNVCVNPYHYERVMNAGMGNLDVKVEDEGELPPVGPDYDPLTHLPHVFYSINSAGQRVAHPLMMDLGPVPDRSPSPEPVPSVQYMPMNISPVQRQPGPSHMMRPPGPQLAPMQQYQQPGPSHMQPGPSHMQPGPSHMQPGPSHMMQGSSQRPGPSQMQQQPMRPGPSHRMPGPSHMQPGPSQMPGPSHMMPGPSHMQQGSSQMPGPSHMQQGSSQMPGPSHIQQGSSQMPGLSSSHQQQHASQFQQPQRPIAQDELLRQHPAFQDPPAHLTPEELQRHQEFQQQLIALHEAGYTPFPPLMTVERVITQPKSALERFQELEQEEQSKPQFYAPEELADNPPPPARMMPLPPWIPEFEEDIELPPGAPEILPIPDNPYPLGHYLCEVQDNYKTIGNLRFSRRNIIVVTCAEPEDPPLDKFKDWVSMMYYEEGRLLSQCNSRCSTVYIDSGFASQCLNRWCIGSLCRHDRLEGEKAAMVRRIGRGVRLSVKESGDIWIQNYSHNPCYVQSHYLDREAGRGVGDVIHKLYTGARIKIFDLARCKKTMREQWISTLMAKCKMLSQQITEEDDLILGDSVVNPDTGERVPLPLAKNDDGDPLTELFRFCVARLSFLSGWGPDYPACQTIDDCQCWVEIKINEAFTFLDTLLTEVHNDEGPLPPPGSTRPLFT